MRYRREERWCWAYTDGACWNNGFRNARAGVGVFWGRNSCLNVSARLRGRQTNNCAEIIAATIAIRQAIADGDDGIIIYTDSQFLKNAAEKWMHRWIHNGWVGYDGRLIANRHEFYRLYRLMTRICVEFRKVRAHGTNIGNLEADRFANDGARMSYHNFSELDYDTEDEN